MAMRRWISQVLSGGVAVALGVSLAAQAGKPAMGHDMQGKDTMGMKDGMMAGGNTMTKAQKIASAVAAGPASISAKATVLDWPAKEGDAPAVLRTGTNGWTCFPDMPDTKGNDPMCVDQAWMKWIEAYVAHKAPDVKTAGVGYMLAPGGAWGSNIDPYAMKETMDNHWTHHAPHMMFLVPDLKSLAGMSTDPNNGGPYVMFPGTPYAHIMAPAVAPAPAMKPGKH